MKWKSCLTFCNPMDYSPWNSSGQNTGVGSLSLLQGIFPTQGLNPSLPHCRWILYQLSHQGSPTQYIKYQRSLDLSALWGAALGLAGLVDEIVSSSWYQGPLRIGRGPSHLSCIKNDEIPKQVMKLVLWVCLRDPLWHSDIWKLTAVVPVLDRWCLIHPSLLPPSHGPCWALVCEWPFVDSVACLLCSDKQICADQCGVRGTRRFSKFPLNLFLKSMAFLKLYKA